MCVNNIALACAEAAFPSIRRALAEKGIRHESKAWHVLQARERGLQVEFDSIDYWMADVPHDHQPLRIGGCVFNVVGLRCLREWYQRGLAETMD